MSGLAGKSALVTGASGFIGSALVRRLVREGAVVHGVSRQARSGGGCARWWQADLTDAEGARRLVREVRPDVLFHLGSLVTGKTELRLVLPVLHANLIAAVNLLVAATEQGVPRVLHAGSMEEPRPDGTWPVCPSPYAAAKLAEGIYARTFGALYGTPAVWLRIFMTYGPGPTDPNRLVPYCIRSFLRGESPEVRSWGRRVDWVYVEDVADAFVAAAVAEGVEGRTLDVGSGRLVTVGEVVEELARIVGGGVAPRRGNSDRPLEGVSVAELAGAAAIGWRPRTSLEEGLRRTVAWYREHPLPTGEGR